jgi:hypothetical protein
MCNRIAAWAARLLLVAVISAPLAAAAAESTKPLETAGVTSPPQSGIRSVPITRILIIGHITRPVTPAELQSVMPGEVRDTVSLYLSGKIADWYIRTDKPGVVFILNITDIKEARDLIGKLPLAQAGMMDFEFIPLGPLSPLGLLLK